MSSSVHCATCGQEAIDHGELGSAPIRFVRPDGTEGACHVTWGGVLLAEVRRLRTVIKTGGAMYRLERAAMGIPGGIDQVIDAASDAVSALGAKNRRFADVLQRLVDEVRSSAPLTWAAGGPSLEQAADYEKRVCTLLEEADALLEGTRDA